MTVYWEEVPMPDVAKACARCKPTEHEIESGKVVVSPSGIAHHGEYGHTDCGHDATGDDWWWPL